MSGSLVDRIHERACTSPCATQPATIAHGPYSSRSGLHFPRRVGVTGPASTSVVHVSAPHSADYRRHLLPEITGTGSNTGVEDDQLPTATWRDSAHQARGGERYSPLARAPCPNLKGGATPSRLTKPCPLPRAGQSSLSPLHRGEAKTWAVSCARVEVRETRIPQVVW